jgi:hypothetical protein
MPVKMWTLLDQSASLPPTVPLAITANDLAGLGSASVSTRVRSGGLADGVFSVEVNNGKLTCHVLPTRGMGLWRIGVAGDDEVPTIGWQSPIRGPVHPAWVDLGEPSGLGWLDGFDELLVRCGLESNGAPEFDDTTGRLKYPLHGRIANRPAHRVELAFDSDTQEIKLVGIVEETRFLFQSLRLTTTLTTRLGSSAVHIRDEIHNFATSPTTMQLLYHLNFGRPLLDAGSRVVAPVKTLVPRNAHAATGLATWDRYAAPQPGFQEMVYFFDLHADDAGRTQTLLRNARGTRGVSLTFDKRQLPCFTLWKNMAGEADGYVTGLEPGTNYPNPRSFEAARGRVVPLAPGATQTFDLTLDVHGSASEVAAADAAIVKIQAGRQPEVHSRPLAEWCA